jgi:hypothetical protein
VIRHQRPHRIVVYIRSGQRRTTSNWAQVNSVLTLHIRQVPVRLQRRAVLGAVPVVRHEEVVDSGWSVDHWRFVVEAGSAIPPSSAGLRVPCQRGNVRWLQEVAMRGASVASPPIWLRAGFDTVSYCVRPRWVGPPALSTDPID